MTATSVYAPRLSLLQARLQAHQALLLTDSHDITYFSGFLTLVPEEREAYLVVTQSVAYLLYAAFSPLPQSLEVEALVGTYPNQVTKHLEYIAGKHHLTELLVDKTRLFVLEFEALIKDCPLKVTALDKKWLWELRMVKDGLEVEALRQAGKLAAQAYQALLPRIKLGVTERQLQLELEAQMRQLGSDQPAFPTIVAFGPHTALPHHQPSDLPLTDNMAVLLDYGATVGGYRSDLTRSFWFGEAPDPEYLKLKKIVDDAYAAVLDGYANGVPDSSQKASVTAADLDIAARELITEAGYGDQYIHTTGHGVGLDIHEPPSLSLRNTQPLKPFMTVTVEPGIYLPGRFGYRYENTVLVTETELVELTLS